MKPVADLDTPTCRGLRGLFCDIDDTLTWEGRLVPAAFQALHDLQQHGLLVVPVTGRPGGWVDQIARMWPVDGVVGENGGLWFYRYQGKLVRRFVQDEATRRQNRQRLDELAATIVTRVPGAALASDQPYRELDLAIDFCEDVPRLSPAGVDAIGSWFRSAGAISKVSSIHVNGWYGAFDKLSGCRGFLKDRFDLDLDADRGRWLFVGDSPNDEPMFRWFEHSVGVANVTDFLPRMTHHPRYVTPSKGGHGFAELARHLLDRRTTGA